MYHLNGHQSCSKQRNRQRDKFGRTATHINRYNQQHNSRDEESFRYES